MSYLSPRKLRSGKLLSQESPNQIDSLPSENRTINMENVNNDESEQSRTSFPSPQNISAIQREIEERFNMLKREMSSLKALMERLLEQNSENVRQVDAAPTTSSFTVQSSNIAQNSSQIGFFY